VLAVIYLIYNEGYFASEGPLQRIDLCDEAARLARQVSDLAPREAEALSLYALILLQESRRAARLDTEGCLVTLEEQERARWDREAIAQGVALVKKAMGLDQGWGTYQLQAAVAALHCLAPNAQSTDWRGIAALYEQSARINPNPVVALNRAVAWGMAEGAREGLRQMEALSEELAQYAPFHAARADLLRRAGLRPESRAAYARALQLEKNEAAQRYLVKQLKSADQSG
jgi:RNA polymerase sigma-70 factor (ECF subfamily)